MYGDHGFGQADLRSRLGLEQFSGLGLGLGLGQAGLQDLQGFYEDFHGVASMTAWP